MVEIIIRKSRNERLNQQASESKRQRRGGRTLEEIQRDYNPESRKDQLIEKLDADGKKEEIRRRKATMSEEDRTRAAIDSMTKVHTDFHKSEGREVTETEVRKKVEESAYRVKGKQ